MNNFKVSGVGIDTSTISYPPSKERCEKDDYDYIFTSISACNDHVVSDYVKLNPGATLIVGVDFLDDFKTTLAFHLLELERSKADLVLFSIPIESWDKYGEIAKESIKSLRGFGSMSEIGLSNPRTVEDIKKVEDILGEDIKYISLDLCPLNFNYDVVSWCLENEVHIIGFNPLGGYLSAANLIESFTLQYLLSFSGNYCDVVMMSGRDLYYSLENASFVRSIIGKESSPKYTLKKNVLGKLVKPFKKVVESSFIISEYFVVPFNDPAKIFFNQEDITLNLGKRVSKFPGEEFNNLRSEVEVEVNNLISTLRIPEDITLQGKLAYLRYNITPLLRSFFPKSSGWNIIKYLNIGKENIIITIIKTQQKSGWWKKKVDTEIDTRAFLLSVVDKETKFIELSRNTIFNN